MQPLSGKTPSERFLGVFEFLFPGQEWPAPKLESLLSYVHFRELEAGATLLREGQVCAAFMPTETVRRLFAESPSFRNYVLDQYSLRMADVMELVEEVAFRRVDQRLAQWLLEHSSSENGLRTISATHQELADHVGTSREVVSRILKDWEERKLLELFRGSLKLLSGFEKIRTS